MRTTPSLVVCAAALVLVLAGGAARAAGQRAVFSVDSSDPRPGQISALELSMLLPTAATASLAITGPPGYAFTPKPVGEQLGVAAFEVKNAVGAFRRPLVGAIVMTDTVPASDPALQACAPGAHTEEWQLALLGAVRATLPIAVDMAPSGGSLRLTLCLGPLRAAGVVPTALTFGLLDVHNPAVPGIYRWSAFVTPFDATGALDQTRASELRADVPLPEALTAAAAFDRKTRILTVRGTLTEAGKPRGGVGVHFVRPLSGEAATIAIGSIRTTASGTYAFRKSIPRTQAAPKLVVAYVDTAVTACTSISTAPDGCTSESVPGADVGPVTVSVSAKR
jgi:hypothetical protein